jgi:predicted Ser/Thr protein kinase
VPIRARVRSEFRLVHEPIGKDDDWELLPEEADVVKRLSDRLRHSSGGTFLITGFRGVGKTTVVRRALGEITDDNEYDVIDVGVSLARPVSTTVLLFEVMRRLVERLTETGLLRALSPRLRDDLLTAYRRTSFAMRQTMTRENSVETQFGVGGDLSLAKVRLPLPRFSRTRSRAETEATEISFLTYTETDVEHDFLRAIDLLSRPDAFRWRRVRGFLAHFTTRFAPRQFPQLVVVFDEIDKLTEEEGGLQTFKTILGGLKNVLAASGVHFVLIAGVDLHDEWLRESATANSLYRSVFAWQGYIACSWQAAERVLGEALEDATDEDFDVLVNYLQYRGRGVIRNVHYELNELIEWEDGKPSIQIDGIAEERVRVLAELSDALQGAFEGAEDSVLSTPSDLDRVKQVAYFIGDWVLRAGRERFTVADVLDPARGTPLDLVLRPTEEMIHKSLMALASGGDLERHQRDRDQETQGPAAERYPDRFQLSATLLMRLDSIARSSPQARAEFGQSSSLTIDPDTEWDWAAGEPKQRAQEVVGERYRIHHQLGQGGFGTVWAGTENERNETVAIKVVRTPSPRDVRRVEREAELLRKANGRGVVRLLDMIDAGDRMALVTELADGIDLSEVERLPPNEVTELGIDVLRIVEGLHQNGIIHADLKPANILMVEGVRPVIVDLGTAELVDEPDPRAAVPNGKAPATSISGTPAYMAPELSMGGSPTEASDVWAVALLLLVLLIGGFPEDRTRETLTAAIVSLPISTNLAECLIRALHPERDRRPSANTFRQELERTPEWQQRPLLNDFPTEAEIDWRRGTNAWR